MKDEDETWDGGVLSHLAEEKFRIKRRYERSSKGDSQDGHGDQLKVECL